MQVDRAGVLLTQVEAIAERQIRVTRVTAAMVTVTCTLSVAAKLEFASVMVQVEPLVLAGAAWTETMATAAVAPAPVFLRTVTTAAVVPEATTSISSKAWPGLATVDVWPMPKSSLMSMQKVGEKLAMGNLFAWWSGGSSLAGRAQGRGVLGAGASVSSDGARSSRVAST